MLKKVIINMLLYTSLICPVLVYAVNSVSNSSKGCPINRINVPFSNFTLNKNCSVFADYSFGGNQLLFCYAGVGNTAGVLEWPYQKAIYTADMPIELTVSPGQKGSANSLGTLHVINNTNASISVNCEYAFI